MRDFGESHILLFITTVVSHVTALPTFYFLYRRRYIFELCAVAFALGTSFMYHTCESLDVTIILNEKQWHRLDNMGIIAMLGVWYTFFAAFPNPAVEMACKCSAIFLAIISQQQHPWDVRFTVAPILLLGLQPVVQHCLINRRPPALHKRQFAIGFLFIVVAVPFFIMGLDDPRDPYRIFHGLWHFFGGLAMLFSWMSVANPTTMPSAVAKAEALGQQHITPSPTAACV